MIELSTEHPKRHQRPTAKATGLAYLIFIRPDLDKAAAFLQDFGLVPVQRTEDELYLRAADSSPFCYIVKQGKKAGFAGMGFTVEQEEDLSALASIENAGSITDAPYPGGGKLLTLTDPSGFHIEIIHGQKTVPKLENRKPLTFNFDQQHSRINATQRPPETPPEILRLGHVVIEVADFQATSAWYTRHLGFIPSDIQVLEDGTPVVTFFRLNLADQPTDHHTFAMAQSFMPAYSHSAFELVDADAVGMGQKIMREKNWKHAWGIGRHILGSQIFDYWQDPWGAKHEHYCDGDLFTAEQQTGIHAVSREAMAQWGQAMPASFTKPKLSLTAIKQLFKNLRSSPDVTFKKISTLAKIFS